MKSIDWLFIIGLTLTPMTAWRIDKVGPAEIVVLIWCLIGAVAARDKLRVGSYGYVWGLALIVLLAGTLHGLSVTPGMTRVVDLITWFYIGLCSVLSVAILKTRTRRELDPVFARAGSVPTLWFGFLYVYSSVISPTFLGAPLWFAQSRYTGGADNPHHVAIVMGSCVFINLRSAIRATSAGGRIWFLALTAVAVFLGLETASATLVAALAVSAAVTAVSLILDKVATERGRAPLKSFILIAVAVAVLLQWQRIIALVEQFLESDANGLGRLSLWASFDDIVDRVLVLGLGAGTYGHSNGVPMEYHNSYLEMAAMLGIPVTVVLLTIAYFRFGKLFPHWTLQVIVLTLLVYSVAGFSFRRISMWLIIALCVAASSLADAESEATDTTQRTAGRSASARS